jgi:hypothetical protein
MYLEHKDQKEARSCHLQHHCQGNPCYQFPFPQTWKGARTFSTLLYPERKTEKWQETIGHCNAGYLC